MYVTAEYYEDYTGLTAPDDFNYLEMIATIYLQSVYPNFPSEIKLESLHATVKGMIKNAICEQIKLGDIYEGTESTDTAFSVGSFSISEGSTSKTDRLSRNAKMLLEVCGVNYKGVVRCCNQYL